jgi:hypothetical protein
MFARKKPEKSDKQENNTRGRSDTQVGIVVKDVILGLQAGRGEKAADMFLRAQAQGILPANRDIVKKLLDILGKNTSDRLVAAFAFHPCQFCTKGRIKCENCDGSGHIEQQAVCEQCFGLGVAKCSFCNGSGWLALADIPEGIRAPALVKRAEKTLNDAESVLALPLPRPSKNNPGSSLKKYAALWVAMDKMTGVLENIVVAFQTSIVPSSQLDEQLHDLVQQAVRMGAKLKQQIREIITVMQKSAQMQAQAAPLGSDHAKLAKNRAEFYRSLLDKSDIVYNLSDTHSFLEEAIKKRLSGKNSPKNRKPPK